MLYEVITKMQKLRVEFCRSPTTLDHDMFHVVVKNLGRNALQIFEGSLMAIKKYFQGAVVDELKIHGPAVTKYQ